MRVLRLTLFQETACYKKPFAFKVGETYPLPPYSTVKGFLHVLLDANDYIPMQISIQGKYDTIFTDYQKHYFFKKAPIKEFALIYDGLGVQPEYEHITTMPIHTHMLYNVELVIHVNASEDILSEIKKRIDCLQTYPSLGRWEDLVRVDACEWVETETTDSVDLKYDAYVPEGILSDDSYGDYRLNWKYTTIKGVRVWEKIKALYVQRGEELDTTFEDEKQLIIDSDRLPVLFYHRR